MKLDPAMILDPAEPVRPSLELTALLARPGSGDVTIRKAPHNPCHHSVVSRDGRSVNSPDTVPRTARTITAMLAPAPQGWSINSLPARIIKPPLPEVCITLSIHTGRGWHAAPVNNKPELLPNCRLSNILTWLPGLDDLAKTYLCQLPSPSENWSPAGLVTIRPMPQLSPETLGLTGDTTPTEAEMRRTIAALLPNLRRDARRQLAETRNHPLTPPPTREAVWTKPHTGRHSQDDGAPIIVHRNPVMLHHQPHHPQANRNCAIVALEMADTHWVPVDAPYPPTGQPGPAPTAFAALAQVRRNTLNLTLKRGTKVCLPAPLQTKGRYRPYRHPPMKARILADFRPEPDDLADLLARCYETDLLQTLAAQSPDNREAFLQTSQFLQHARETAHRLLTQNQDART